MNTTFVDYTFALTPAGDIVFDDQLTLEQLQCKVGDEFVIILVEGRIVLKKFK